MNAQRVVGRDCRVRRNRGTHVRTARRSVPTKSNDRRSMLLPIHFGTAGLGSAAGLLELLGHRIAALNALGYYAVAIESALLIWLSVNKHGVADRAIHEHGSGSGVAYSDRRGFDWSACTRSPPVR